MTRYFTVDCQPWLGRKSGIAGDWRRQTLALQLASVTFCCSISGNNLETKAFLTLCCFIARKLLQLYRIKQRATAYCLTCCRRRVYVESHKVEQRMSLKKKKKVQGQNEEDTCFSCRKTQVCFHLNSARVTWERDLGKTHYGTRLG